MVTAAELNDSIIKASTREELSRHRATCRRLRTNKCKVLAEVQDKLSMEDIEDEDLTKLETEEDALEVEIIALTKAAEAASLKISTLMRETRTVSSTNLSTDDSDGVITSTEAVSGLAKALSSALSRRPYDSRTKRADINRLSMHGRILIDPYQLPAHFRRLEQFFANNEFGSVDDSKEFTADTEVEAQLVEKAIESFSSHPNVVSEANSLVDTHGCTWQHLKSSLIDKFAKPEDIRRELKRKVSQLIYKGHSNIDAFISELRQIYTLASTINSSAEDSVYFIDDVLKCLPPNVHSQLVQDINQTARLSRGSDSSSPPTNSKPWQLKLPFDATSNQHSILGILSDVAQSLMVSTDFRKASTDNNRGQRRDDMRDRISKLNDTADNNAKQLSTAISEARRVHKEANDWARKQALVIVVMGKALRSSAATDPGFSAARDTRFLVSRQGKRYGLLAFDNKADAERTIAEHFSDKEAFSLVKPYDPDYRSKKRLRASQPVGDCRRPVNFSPTSAITDHLSHELTDDSIATVGVGPNLPEISLSLLLSSETNDESNDLKVRGVLDTGATNSYIVVPLSYSINFNTDNLPQRVAVTLANGTQIAITSSATFSISVRDVKAGDYFEAGSHCLRVLNCHENLQHPYVLIGRDLIQAWNLVCVGLESVTLSGHVVYDATALSSPHRATNSIATLFLIGDNENPTTVVALPTVDGLSFGPSQLADCDKDIATGILDNLASQGWRSLPLSDGYSCRIRKLYPVEHRDSPHQLYVGELLLPALNLTTKPSNKDFATPLFKRLSPDLKEAYKVMIQDYVDKKWWVPASTTTSTTMVPAASVFLIRGSKRPRLVCDLRVCNASLPRASSRNPDLWKVISILRITGPSIIVGADISSAFYSVRLSVESKTTRFLLRTALGNFWSIRSLFGTSIGPSSLGGTMGSSVEAVRGCESIIESPTLASAVPRPSTPSPTNTPRKPVQANAVSNLQCFVDDIIISGFIFIVVLHLLAVLLHVLSLLAFNCQPKKCAILTTHQEETEQACTQFGLPFPIAPVVAILGVLFSYKAVSDDPTTQLSMNCDAGVRMAKALSLINKDPILAQRPSKLDIFSLGGLLSFDQGRVHGERRLISDILKVIIARNFPSAPWNQPSDLTTMPLTEQQAFEAAILWAREACTLSSSCDHRSPLRQDGQTDITLIVETDASLYSGATIIRIDDFIILQDVYRFSARQVSYSSNRRELLMCLQGLRRAAELITYYHTTTTSSTQWSPISFTIDFRTDNKSSCSWLSNENAVLKLQNSKILERRAIIRLIDSIAEELRVIRQFGKLSISHLAGVANHYADKASRFLDRPVPTSSGNHRLGELLATYKKTDLKPFHITKDDDVGDHCCWIESLTDDNVKLMSDALDVDSSFAEDINYDPLGKAKRLYDCEAEVYSCCCLVEDAVPTKPRQNSSSHKCPSSPLVASIASDSTNITDSVCRALDSIFTIRDDLCQISPVPTPTTEPLVETIARYSWDVDSILDRVRLLRSVIGVLRLNATSPDAPSLDYDWNQSWTQDDVICAAHSAQFTTAYGKALGDIKQRKGTSWDILDPTNLGKVLAYRCGLPTGEVILQPWIPSTNVCFINKVILSAHRSCRHGCLPTTASRVKLFHVQSLIRMVKSVINKCVTCKILHSTRTWSVPCGMGDTTAEEMFHSPPYTYATCDVLSLGDHSKLLTVQCRATRHICWKHLDDDTENIVNILRALKRVKRSVGGLRYLYTDQAGYFRSEKFRQGLLQELRCELRLLPRYSPWSGSNERHHRTALNMLRSLLRHDAGRIGKLTPTQRQDIYDEVTLMHNSLPIGVYTLEGATEIPLTSDMLAFGHTRADSFVDVSTLRTVTPWIPYAIVRKARNIYLSHMWSIVKKRNSELRPIRRQRVDDNDNELFNPGAPVLVYTGVPRKLSPAFSIAHVKDRLSTNRVRIIHPNGTTTIENLRNVVPMLHHDRDPPQQDQLSND